MQTESSVTHANFSQNSPLYDGKQRHWQVNGSKIPPFWQLSVDLHDFTTAVVNDVVVAVVIVVVERSEVVVTIGPVVCVIIGGSVGTVHFKQKIGLVY